MRLYDPEFVLAAVAVRSLKCYLGWRWVCNSKEPPYQGHAFLISGETIAILSIGGKMPSEKERLARVEMSSEKTEEQDLRSEVGIKS